MHLDTDGHKQIIQIHTFSQKGWEDWKRQNVVSGADPYVHSIIAYGIIFWGNSPYSNNIFKLQKRTIRIIMNASNRVSFHELFKKLNILPLHSQYILSLLLLVVKNIEEFISNSEVHSINTRHRSDSYPPSIKWTKYQKGVYYSGIKIFSHLPQNIKSLSWNVKKFKLALKRFLLMGSFYTLEYFDWISRSNLGSFTYTLYKFCLNFYSQNFLFKIYT